MNKAEELFQQAVARLNFVNEELNRPEEDVMTFSVCHQTRGIMSDLLSSYLLKNGKDISAAPDVDVLQVQCGELDNRFSLLDLTVMHCHPGNTQTKDMYCMDMERVGSCLRMANVLKEMIEGNFEQARQA
ncbi:MAG: hypothetical protein K1X81_09085 [Bacteroidia bacterium]|nr:hypothetical protein [Bacteroidia bacterium]